MGAGEHPDLDPTAEGPAGEAQAEKGKVGRTKGTEQARLQTFGCPSALTHCPEKIHPLDKFTQSQI